MSVSWDGDSVDSVTCQWDGSLHTVGTGWSRTEWFVDGAVDVRCIFGGEFGGIKGRLTIPEAVDFILKLFVDVVVPGEIVEEKGKGYCGRI